MRTIMQYEISLVSGGTLTLTNEELVGGAVGGLIGAAGLVYAVGKGIILPGAWLGTAILASSGTLVGGLLGCGIVVTSSYIIKQQASTKTSSNEISHSTDFY